MIEPPRWIVVGWLTGSERFTEELEIGGMSAKGGDSTPRERDGDPVSISDSYLVGVRQRRLRDAQSDPHLIPDRDLEW
jgi:hypothetical protein